MKKFIALFVVAVLSASLTSCANETESSSDNSFQESSVSESSSNTENTEGGPLLNNFSDIIAGSVYYIDVSMLTETYSTESVSFNRTSTYDYIIAIDKDKNRAALNIKDPDKKAYNIVIKDNIGYEINHESKNVITHSSDLDIDDFARSYTTYLWIGSTSGMKLTSYGVTEYKGKEYNYEKYSLSDVYTSSETNSSIITYYFDNGVPAFEILESMSGKTTFTFNKVSGKIEDESVFDIPDDYETSSGDNTSQ